MEIKQSKNFKTITITRDSHLRIYMLLSSEVCRMENRVSMLCSIKDKSQTDMAEISFLKKHIKITRQDIASITDSRRD